MDQADILRDRALDLRAAHDEYRAQQKICEKEAANFEAQSAGGYVATQLPNHADRQKAMDNAEAQLMKADMYARDAKAALKEALKLEAEAERLDQRAASARY